MNEKTQSGQALVILTLVMIGILVAAGLAADAAILFWNRADLVSRADAAALAGGGELTNTLRATEKAYEYLALHNILTSTHTISVTFRTTTVTNDTINVKLWRTVPTSFLHLIGIDEVTVSAEAEVLASSWAGQQSWTMFRGGPDRTGFQQCNGLDADVDAVQYSFGHRWTTDDGANHRSTPATYQDDRLFSGHTFVVVGSNDNGGGGNGASPQGGTKVYAFDTVNGNTLWESDLNGTNTKVRSSPLIAVVPGLNGPSGGEYPVVFVNGHNGVVYALDARDGSLIWSSPNTNDDYEDDDKYRASPALVQEGANYYIYTATSRGNVYKLNVLTGTIIWRSTPFPGSYPYPNPGVPQNWVTNSWGSSPSHDNTHWGYTQIYSTPNVAFVDSDNYGTLNKRVVIVVSRGGEKKKVANDIWLWPGESSASVDRYVHVFAIDADTGERLWASDAIAVLGGKVHISRDSAAFGKVDTDNDGSADTWRVFVAPTDGYLHAFNIIQAINTQNGATVWSVDTGSGHHRSDPVIYCDVVFAGNDTGMWALTAADGVSIWDGTDSDGAGLDQVNPEFLSNPSAYTSAGEFIIPGGVKSAPAIVEGIIMVGANKTSTGGTGGSMWALEARTGKDLGHWDTTDYDYPNGNNGLGPEGPPSGNNGDVRSGVVVADNFNAYFGSNDTGLYEVYITALLILIK